MKIIQPILCTALFMGTTSFTTDAQEPSSDSTLIRPVNSIYSFEAGASHITDTYLSPVKYTGWHAGINYTRNQAMKFNPLKWVMSMNLSLSIDRDLNPAKNHSLLYGHITFDWGMVRRYKLAEGFSTGIGGSASLSAGCIYMNRGGNNPASAKGAVTANITAYAAWNGTLLGKRVTFRYQPTLPVTGVFFAPDYGELYYEIYLGNRSGLVHMAHWGNYFKLENVISADITFGSTILRIGYKGNIHSTDINHTVTNIFTHSAIIGIGGEWLSYKPGKTISKETKVITSTY